MLFAEGNDGARSNTVTESVADGDTVLVKFDLAVKGVADLYHKTRRLDDLYLNMSLTLVNLLTGVDGVFNSVGKYRGKLGIVNRKRIRESQSRVYLDMSCIRDADI